MVDISKLHLPDTAEIHIEHPQIGKLYADENKTQPVVIEIHSPASNQSIAYKRKMQQEAQARVSSKGAKSALKFKPEELEEMEIQRMVALTASVRHLEFEDGEPVTVDNVIRLYRDEKMGWLTDQVRARIGGWDDFLG